MNELELAKQGKHLPWFKQAYRKFAKGQRFASDALDWMSTLDSLSLTEHNPIESLLL